MRIGMNSKLNRLVNVRSRSLKYWFTKKGERFENQNQYPKVILPQNINYFTLNLNIMLNLINKKRSRSLLRSL